MSRYNGREVDDVALWSNYIDVPMSAEKEEYYWDRVVCPNPAHDTMKRHFQVNVQRGLVHCFAECGISGTYQHAIKMIEGCSDREARKIIRKFATGVRRKTKVAKRDSRPDGNTTPAPSLEYDSFIPQAGLNYLAERGVVPATCTRFGIGWCPETLRIVIPARDINGQVRFLIKRAVRESQHPKYLYTENVPKTSVLYGACETDHRLIRSQGIVLVEGSLDAVALNQHGLQNVAAVLGSGISTRQVAILSRLRPRRVFCFFDKDRAGVAAIENAERQLRGKYPVFVVRYPKGRSDPAECSRREVERAIDRAIPLRNFKRTVRQLERTG